MPVYNEQEGILAFHESLVAVPLPSNFSRRYIYIDDGSTDETVTTCKGCGG